MAKSRAGLFTESFVRRKIERQGKEWIKEFTSGFPVEDFRYAAEHNLNIADTILKSDSRRSMRKKLTPYRHLIEGMTASDFIRLIDSVAPQHASILGEYKEWFARQVEIVRQDIFGEGE